MHARWTTAAGLACLATSVLVGFGTSDGTAAAAEANNVLHLVALTGPRGGDVTIAVPAAAGGADVNELLRVHVRLFDANDADGEPNRIVNVDSIDAERGVANLALGRVARGTRVEVQAQVREQEPPRTVILRGRAIAKLRPDLVVAAVHAPPQTLTTRPVDVVADVEELNGETGAEAKLTLMLGPSRVAEAESVAVGPGGSGSAIFEDVRLTEATTAELIVRVENADPYETDTSNNGRRRTIEVTEHELVRANVLVDSLGGYGAQFNQHVYAPISNVPPASLAGMEAVAKELEPQLVRIFYNDNWEERRPEAPQNLESFYRTVALAHDSGATINITYQALSPARNTPAASMARFAGVLEDLVENRGYTNVRWVTVGNEPNGGNGTFPLPIYEQLNRALHAELVARGVRGHIRIMAGDLVEAPSFGPNAGIPNHREWFAYMAERMNDIVDAWSVHIYWRYHDEYRMEQRLKDVHKIVTQELPLAARKPTYLMEFAVRGMDPFPQRPIPRYAFYEDGTEMRKTNVAAFQTLWFSIWSAQLGYAGAAKWDAYWGLYDLSSVNNQSYWLTGTPQEGWPLHPTYHALRLLLQTTARGWQVVQVGPWDTSDWRLDVLEQHEQEIVGYADSDGALTLFGLDTNGSQLTGASPETSRYSIGGLPADTTFTLALWNATGNGESSVAGTVAANAAGVVRFDVPLHAAFALTTVPVS